MSADKIRKVAIVSSSATALVLFRGPLIREMRRRGYAVAALAPDFTGELKEDLRGLGAEPLDYRLERKGTSFLGDLGSVRELYRVLRHSQPDLVLSHFMKPVIYGTTAAVLARVPRRYAMIEGLGYAFTDTGEESLTKKALKLTMQGLLRLALAGADRIVFLNDDDRNELVRARIAPEDRSEVLGGIGLPLEDFPFDPPLPDRPPVFLMIGRLLKEKGVFEFVDAARIVRQRLAGARFILVGGLDPKPGSPTEAQVEEWARSGLIEWRGQVSDVRPYLRQATIYVLPSYREGVPRSTQEAMAIGRAVITTDVPGCRSTVEDGVNGLLVPPRDAHALAEAMIDLAQQPDLVIKMGYRSRAMAEEKFDVQVVNARLLEFMSMDAPSR
jgi:glycosyltransferase involved in cell wall biosynthesis